MKHYAIKRGKRSLIIVKDIELAKKLTDIPDGEFKEFSGYLAAKNWLMKFLPEDEQSKEQKSKPGPAEKKECTPVENGGQITFSEQPAENKYLDMYSDGSCLQNPGPGGWAFAVCIGGKDYECSGNQQNTTNNQMELTAAVKAMQYVINNSLFDKSIRLFSDSQYVCNCINQGWAEKWQRFGWKKPDGSEVKNIELIKELLKCYKILQEKTEISFCWVKGHAGNPQNERCDELARIAAKFDKF